MLILLEALEILGKEVNVEVDDDDEEDVEDDRELGMFC